MLSKQTQTFHAKIDAIVARAAEVPDPSSVGAEPDLHAIRASFGALSASLGVPVAHAKQAVSARGVRAVWFVPEGITGTTVVLFMHGGGYMACSPETHASIATQLARRLDGRVLSVDYRWAPEHRFPDQIEDCLAVYQWLLEQGVKPERIVFAGESAGASLCVTTQLLAKARQLPTPAAAYLMSPWVDLETSGESYEKTANDLTSRDGTRLFRAMYLGSRAVDRANELLCPLAAPLRGLAPMFVQVGGDERLLDDARHLAANARHDGVAVELDIVPSMRHLFQMNVGEMPEADEAVDRAVAFLGRFVP